MSTYITNIRGFVKFKGEPGITEFYNKDEEGNLESNKKDKITEWKYCGRRYLQMVIDEHETIIDLDYKKSQSSLYRFEITNYKDGKVISCKKSAYFKDELNHWKLLGRTERTFND